MREAELCSKPPGRALALLLLSRPCCVCSGLHLVRVFDPQTPGSYAVVASMATGRWKPTLCTLPDGNVLLLGAFS